MATINLKDYYPFYHHDIHVEISDELAQQFIQWERDEKAYQRKRTRNQARYSLDRGDGIEGGVTFASYSPDELYERRLTMEQLYKVMAQLPEKQSRRIFAHYFMGISLTDMARAEGLNPSSVQRSVLRGLRQLEKLLKNIFERGAK